MSGQPYPSAPLPACEVCGTWDHVHGARQALINAARTDLGRSTTATLDPHSEVDRRIILSIYAREARAAMGSDQ